MKPTGQESKKLPPSTNPNLPPSRPAPKRPGPLSPMPPSTTPPPLPSIPPPAFSSDLPRTPPTIPTTPPPKPAITNNNNKSLNTNKKPSPLAANRKIKNINNKNIPNIVTFHFEGSDLDYFHKQETAIKEKLQRPQIQTDAQHFSAIDYVSNLIKLSLDERLFIDGNIVKHELSAINLNYSLSQNTTLENALIRREDQNILEETFQSVFLMKKLSLNSLRELAQFSKYLLSSKIEDIFLNYFREKANDINIFSGAKENKETLFYIYNYGKNSYNIRISVRDLSVIDSNLSQISLPLHIDYEVDYYLGSKKSKIILKSLTIFTTENFKPIIDNLLSDQSSIGFKQLENAANTLLPEDFQKDYHQYASIWVQLLSIDRAFLAIEKNIKAISNNNKTAREFEQYVEETGEVLTTRLMKLLQTTLDTPTQHYNFTLHYQFYLFLLSISISLRSAPTEFLKNLASIIGKAYQLKANFLYLLHHAYFESFEGKTSELVQLYEKNQILFKDKEPENLIGSIKLLFPNTFIYEDLISNEKIDLYERRYFIEKHSVPLLQDIKKLYALLLAIIDNAPLYNLEKQEIIQRAGERFQDKINDFSAALHRLNDQIDQNQLTAAVNKLRENRTFFTMRLTIEEEKIIEFFNQVLLKNTSINNMGLFLKNKISTEEFKAHNGNCHTHLSKVASQFQEKNKPTDAEIHKNLMNFLTSKMKEYLKLDIILQKNQKKYYLNLLDIFLNVTYIMNQDLSASLMPPTTPQKLQERPTPPLKPSPLSHSASILASMTSGASPAHLLNTNVPHPPSDQKSNVSAIAKHSLLTEAHPPVRNSNLPSTPTGNNNSQGPHLINKNISKQTSEPTSQQPILPPYSSSNKTPGKLNLPTDLAQHFNQSLQKGGAGLPKNSMLRNTNNPSSPNNNSSNNNDPSLKKN